MIDVSKVMTAEGCRNLMKNAKDRGRDDVWRAAFRRLNEIEGKDHEDPVVVQFWQAIAAVEQILREKHGRIVRAAYTRRKVAKVGEVACLTDWALKPHETEGFRMLIEAGLGDQTGEYVVVQNPDRFPAVAVVAAKARLASHGISSGV